MRPRPLPRAVTRVALPALVAALIAASARFDAARATFMIPDPPFRPKEAALVYRDSFFHVFYTRGIPTAAFDSTWNDLGHAISPDLRQWTDQGPVLPKRPGFWDNHQVWSPCIVETDSLYYLFYTGVSDSAPYIRHHQRIGLATSRDLVTWTRRPAPLFSCYDVPWTLCDSTQDGKGDFRDAYVMPDPDSAGHWIMYYTTRHKTIPGQLMIGMARSSGDLTRWRDAGPMWNTTALHTGSSVVESPDLIRHGNLWYLFYTTWNAHPIWYQTATDPTADSSGWSPQKAIADEDPALYSDPSFGPEHYTWHGHDLYYMPNSDVDGIQFLEFVWEEPPHFLLVEPRIYPSAAGVADDDPRLALRASGDAESVRLSIQLPSAAPAALWIADVGGRHVRRILNAPLRAGRTERTWDGRTAAGAAAPPGVYFAVLDTPLGRRTARFVLLR